MFIENGDVLLNSKTEMRLGHMENDPKRKINQNVTVEKHVSIHLKNDPRIKIFYKKNSNNI